MMVSSFLWASAFCIYAVSAFQDTSPFFLFSTSTYTSQIRDLYSGIRQANVAFRHFQSQSPQIVKAATLSRNLERQLGHCPSDAYVLVSQAGVSTADYSSKGSMSQMRAKMLGKEGRIGSSMSVQDVLGNLDIEAFSRMLQDKCGAALTRIDASTGAFAIADEKKPRVMTLELPALPSGPGWAKKLGEHDAFLASILDWLPSPEYTVIYTTTPSTFQPQPSSAESETYEMDTAFGSPVHMDLKRDLSSHQQVSSNVTLPAGPLFERYQFFNPGLFMAFIVAFVLLSILYVAISGVASLQVSYAAFDKEVGAAQKKA